MYAPPTLTFDSFTVAEANAAALDAARRVAEDRPDAPALLLLYGPPWAGKTHLLSAIGASRRARAGDGGSVVEYVAFSEFLARLRAPSGGGFGGARTDRYEGADLLLVDDAQGARAGAAHVLAQLLEAGKPGRCVVLALNCPPGAVSADEPRLARLFAAATACHVAPLPAARRPRATPADVARHVPERELADVGAAGARTAAHEPLAAFADANETIGGGSPGVDGAPLRAPAEPQPNDYASFLSDVVAAVTQHVEPWKQRLAEASNRWGALGYAVAVLERALARPAAPDVDGLLATYAAAVEHLRRLEAQAAAIDPGLAGSPVFRNPERVGDAEGALAQLLPAGPDTYLTQATFVASSSNGAAVEAASAAVAAPGARHNPLYVHGPSGSGRTHLVAATANAMRAWRAGRVAYVAAPQLAQELAAAMRANTVERWRARYGSVDVLAVDDVHELAGNARAEQEVALLCATLRERGRQVVLASALDPTPDNGVGEGLRLQIERGHAVPLGAPDRDLRGRLIAAYFAAARRDVAPDVIDYLAERVEPSAHSVAPTAERLLAAADRAGVPLTLPIARSELGRTPARTPLWAVITSGAHVDAFFLDPEKVIWDYPDVSARVIEELR